MVHMMIHDAPLYNWHSLLLVFSAPEFYNRPLPFHVLSAFMIHYVQLALSVHLLKTRLCYVAPFSVLIVLLLLPNNKHYFGLCSKCILLSIAVLHLADMS